MTTARVLSTAELGAIRFADAQSANKWPVEIRFVEGPDTFVFGSRNARETFLTLRTECSDGSRAEMSMAPSTRAEWRAVPTAPSGLLNFHIYADDVELVSSTVDVVPPDAPFASTLRRAQLRTRKSSGAEQVPTTEPVKRGSPFPEKLPSGDPVTTLVQSDPVVTSSSHTDPAESDDLVDLWRVEFVYAEETWSVREVWIDMDGSIPVMMDRDEDGNFSASLSLPVGVCRYRFRVFLRDAARPDAAPFTRLGWDAGASDVSFLRTWQLTVPVNDLSDGKTNEAGDGLMRVSEPPEAQLSHETQTSPNENQSPVSQKEKPSVDIQTKVNVRAAAALLDAADASFSSQASADSLTKRKIPKQDAREQKGESTQKVAREDPKASSDSLESPVADDFSPRPQFMTTDAKNSNARRRTLAILPIIGVACVSIIFALVSRARQANNANSFRFGRRESDLSSIREAQISYYDHARAQGL